MYANSPLFPPLNLFLQLFRGWVFLLTNKRTPLIDERTLFSTQPNGLDKVACPYCHSVGFLYVGVTKRFVGCSACVMYFDEEDFVDRFRG